MNQLKNWVRAADVVLVIDIDSFIASNPQWITSSADPTFFVQKNSSLFDLAERTPSPYVYRGVKFLSIARPIQSRKCHAVRLDEARHMTCHNSGKPRIR